MRNIHIALLVLVTLAGCVSPKLALTEKLDYRFSKLQGVSLKSFIDDFGPIFDVQPTEHGYTVVKYQLHAKGSGLVFVPFVNMLTAGNSHIVQRCELNFSDEDAFDGQAVCTEAEGYSTVWTMAGNEGMTGTGGYVDQLAYQRVGEFLAEKRLFFNQDKWKFQNVANNYYMKYAE
jgi:hypothetical protein